MRVPRYLGTRYPGTGKSGSRYTGYPKGFWQGTRVPSLVPGYPGTWGKAPKFPDERNSGTNFRVGYLDLRPLVPGGSAMTSCNNPAKLRRPL
eukprot:2086100-Rhodomonas_salina.2